VKSTLIMGQREKKEAPKTKLKGRKEKADWTDEAEIEVLAWLDYLLDIRESIGKEQMTKSHFENSITDHLEKTCRMRYTIAQVERKIRKFWQVYGGDYAVDRNEIYKLGTECLVNLPPDRKERICTRVGVLKDEAYAATLSRQRQLRSTSRTTESQLSRFTSLEAVEGNVPSPRKRRVEVVINKTSKDDFSPKKLKVQAAEVSTTWLFNCR
jgi:hypothetical protein